jgi:hypothetical protein
LLYTAVLAIGGGKIMSKFVTLVATSLFLLVVNNPAIANRSLDPVEVNALFIGKTVYSYHELKRFDIVVFYDSSGKFLGERNGKESSGTWRVKENGEICTKRYVIERCRKVMEDNGVYKMYKVENGDEPVLITTIKEIKSGNVNGY